jgi:CRP-like cAMP-binding protein
VDDALVRMLAEHVALLSERLVEAYTVDAETRVARRVLELSRVYGGSPPVVIPLIQEELAALAGASRATVNRVLREAEGRGLVQVGRGRTVVLDPDGLARLARVRS